MKAFKFNRKTVWITALCVIAAAALTAAAVLMLNMSKPASTHTESAVSSEKAESTYSEEAQESSQEASSVQPEESTASKPVTPLKITNPSALKTTVTQPKARITGKCDTSLPLTLNGKKVEYSKDGSFSAEVELERGNNTFEIEQNGVKKVYSIFYRYVVMDAYNPSKGCSVDGGTMLRATVHARAGSKVTAQLGGQTISLEFSGKPGMPEDEFCNFISDFKIPASKSTDQNLGKIKFTAEYDGVTESFYSGNIICRKIYVPQIAEIVNTRAETFDGNTRDNTTRPTNNYLPKGTVDYVTDSFTAVDGKYRNNFIKLRCGRRVYSDLILTPGPQKRIPVVKIREGKLPDHNEIKVAAVENSSKYTVITLDSMWKAPFLLDLLPQKYTNPAAQDYTVASFTAQYVEIKFCYATVFEGAFDFGADNPVFRSAEIIKNNDSTTVRLYLKKAGAFYGWDCEYNSKNQLVFKFRHPAAVKADASKPYGVDLSGLKIVVDAGHGGIDPGAATGNCVERDRNLILAGKIKKELEKTGAEVIMTRTQNGTTIYSDQRIEMYRKAEPDFMVSVHHDSSTSSRANGFGSYYTTPFSHAAANAVFKRTVDTGLYNRGQFTKLKWHHFFLSRMTFCPGILTENGYVSSPFDRPVIMDDAKNQIKAEAIVRGITDYFKTLL